MDVEGTYVIEVWEQETYEDTQPSLAHATVKTRFAGAFAGVAATRYLMVSLPDGSSDFLGQLRFTGEILGRAGSVVLHETGEYREGNTACGTLTIVPGSGTGELAGIRGEGHYVATHGDEPVDYAGRTWQPTDNRTASYIFSIEQW